jgi:large subunit ribosomal protein L10
MPNAEKVRAVGELAEQFRSASAALITDYRGLTVKQVTQLRRSLGKDAKYEIVKNTLTKRAAADSGMTIDDSLLVGPTAIAFVHGDVVVAAKGLRDFATTNPVLAIKGGVVEGRQLTAAEITRIADLESREVLLAKLAGALKALSTRAAGLMQAPIVQFARLVKALEDKKSASEDAAAAPQTESVAVPAS